MSFLHDDTSANPQLHLLAWRLVGQDMKSQCRFMTLLIFVSLSPFTKCLIQRLSFHSLHDKSVTVLSMQEFFLLTQLELSLPFLCIDICAYHVYYYLDSRISGTLTGLESCARSSTTSLAGTSECMQPHK